LNPPKTDVGTPEERQQFATVLKVLHALGIDLVAQTRAV
jgi:DNA-binding phage protein